MENMAKGLTVPEWVLVVRPKKYPKCPKIYQPKLSAHLVSAQAQKMKKGFIGRL